MLMLRRKTINSISRDKKLEKNAIERSKFRLPSFSRAKLSLQEQSLFARRLSLLVKAGMPILESINILKKQAKSLSNKKMFETIFHDVSNGQFLSKSLGRFSKVFGSFAVNIIKVGETSGTLSENLKYLSQELDKKRELKRKITGALVYPLFIMVAAFAVSALLTVYLFPKLLPVFQSLKVELPFTTRALLGLSTFLIKFGFFLLAGLIAAFFLFIFLLRFRRFKFQLDRFFLRLPLVGLLLKHYYLANICRTLGLLLKSQVRVLEAVQITADTTANLIYERELRNLHRDITKGGTFSKYFEKNERLFPVLVSEMLSVGEATGNLSETLLYLSEIYEQELNDETKRLSNVIEPAMMILMGLMIGFIAISIITPIYEVTQHLSPR